LRATSKLVTVLLPLGSSGCLDCAFVAFPLLLTRVSNVKTDYRVLMLLSSPSLTIITRHGSSDGKAPLDVWLKCR